MDDHKALLARIAKLETLVAEQAARIKELEAELRRRGKKFTPKVNAKPPAPQPDRRTKAFRRHPGTTRPIPSPSQIDEIIEHDVAIEECPQCGGTMSPTGEFSDHFVEDIPEPKVEVHRYRRHVCRCQACGATAQGRSDLAAPGSHLGPRAKLLTVYGRDHLGISLGKTTALFEELFGLRLSTAAASGHLRNRKYKYILAMRGTLAGVVGTQQPHAGDRRWRGGATTRSRRFGVI